MYKIFSRYFTAPYYDPATKKLIPSESHLYYVDDSGNYPNSITCVTCTMLSPYNEPCKSNEVDISPGNTVAAISCNGPGAPTYRISNLKVLEILFFKSENELNENCDFFRLVKQY